jgi:valyl-tRNA synthetase
VFVELYRDLIYRDKRLVNWDPKLLTAISDLEVQQVSRRGTSGTSGIRLRAARHVHHGGDHAAETMLGDTAVAVHPDDPRYRKLVGRIAIPPHWSAAASRSSLTSIPIPRRGPAPSRSRRRMTSTTSRSAGGTICR